MKLNCLVLSLFFVTGALVSAPVPAFTNQQLGCSVITVAEELDWTPLLFILLGIVPIVLLRLRKQHH